MTAISMLVASERAKRYRELAKEARGLAARSKRVPRFEEAYLGMAGRWEELALEANAEAQEMLARAPGESPANAPEQRQGVADGSVIVQRPG